MIYTIGKTIGYEKYMRDNLDPRKGIGGSVWQNLEDVRRYLEETQQHDYSIYGVEADWDKDTEEAPGEPWRTLIRSARLVAHEN